MPRLLLDVEEAARLLMCSTKHVRRLMGTGEIPSVKVGELRRIRRVDLDVYVASLEGRGVQR